MKGILIKLYLVQFEIIFSLNLQNTIFSKFHYFPYNYYGQSIPDVFDIVFEYNSGDKEIKTTYGEGSFTFSETKREIEISFKPVNVDFGAENIFVGRLSWKIMKLTKDGVLKIQAKDNFKLYEIQFN